jgi:hypothetical protein
MHLGTDGPLLIVSRSRSAVGFGAATPSLACCETAYLTLAKGDIAFSPIPCDIGSDPGELSGVSGLHPGNGSAAEEPAVARPQEVICLQMARPPPDREG